MTADEFRTLALSVPEATQNEHMQHPDFRVRGKIFATLGPDATWGMVKLTPEQQASFVGDEPKVFEPFNGAWGRRGGTRVWLARARQPLVQRALSAAWCNTAPKQLVQQHEGTPQPASRKRGAPTKKTAQTKQGTSKPAAPEIDPRFAPIVEHFAKDREVTYGKMMASMGLQVTGKIFAMMVRGKLVAKLPKARVDALVGAGEGENFDPGHGRLMKEWVAVAPGKASWLELAKEAHRFVKTGKA